MNEYHSKCSSQTRSCACIYNGMQTCTCTYSDTPACRDCCPPWGP
jgi:hypothetical protein